MKTILHTIFFLSSITAISQEYFFKKIDFTNGSNGTLQLYENDSRIFTATSHFCGPLECTSISELSMTGDTLWVTTLLDVDVGLFSVYMRNDTLIVGGNNDEFNNKFMLALLDTHGNQIGSTMTVDHPVEKFTRMFHQNTVQFNDKLLISGRGIQNDTMKGLVYVLDANFELDTLIQLEPQEWRSVLWDIEINDQNEMLTYHEIVKNGAENKYRVINKFDSEYNLIWRYQSEKSIFWNGTATGIEMEDGRVIITGYKENSSRENESIRAINYDKSIDWEYVIPPFTFNGYESTTNIKQLANGDLLGMGRYADFDEDIEGAPFIYRMTTEGDILWKRAFSDIDPEDGDIRSGFVRDAIELENGDIFGVGQISKGQVSQSFSFKVDSNGCFDPENCDVVYNVTSASDISMSKAISIYPNPTSDYINFQSDENLSDVSCSLYDYSGNMLMTQKIKNVNQSIDISFLPSGLYNIVFTDQNKIIFKKSIVVY